MKKFSEKYRSFRAWLIAKSRESRYARRIVFLHKLFPRYRLEELQNLNAGDYDFSKKHWVDLTPKQKVERTLSVDVLRSLRHKGGIAESLKRTGLHKDSLFKNVGKHLLKKGKKWKVSRNDSIEIGMNLYENGKYSSIITKSYKDRRLLGQYFADVKQAQKENSSKILKKYKKIILKDANGNKHSLETDLDKIYEIEEQIEDIEMQEIYKNTRR